MANEFFLPNIFIFTIMAAINKVGNSPNTLYVITKRSIFN